MRTFSAGLLTLSISWAIAGSGCSTPAENDDDTMGGAGTDAAPGAGGDTSAPPSGGGGSVATPSGGGGSGAAAGSGPSAGGAGTMSNPNGTPPPPPTTPPPVPEELDKSVDWTALKLIYPTAFSAFDGEHTFKVPFYVDGATVELAGWSAIPSDSVTFDADPELGGVIVTVVKDVPEITIAARSETIGGVALLNVTSATPAQWVAGEARYNNGIEFDLPTLDPAMFAELLLDPNWMPPKPPGDIACNNCHTTGAKYFEIQHSPTQAARFSDDQLRQILSTGTKPTGVGYRILPEMLGNMTADEVYKSFHTWESTEEEIVGLIVYLRSLTPVGQGDILLPDGTYVAPGTDLPMAGTGG
jgi:hypothetical protein